MKKKLPLLLLLFLVCILSISAISATENTANNDVIGADNNKENNLEINIPDDNVSTGKENFELSLEQNNNDELKDSGELNFNDLNRIINGNSNSTIYLSSNYKYDEESDSELVNGVIIDRNLTIYGNGITLNGNKMARIFNVIDFNLNVSFYDMHFINGHSSNGCGGAIRGGTAYNCNFDHNYAYDGGALCSGTAYNCTFKDNEAEHDGGAIFDGNAYNCTFTENEAVTGGAMSDSNAYNSTFKENKADKGGAMYGGVAFNSTFTKNEADNGGAMYKSVADECFFKKNHADDGGGAMYKGEAFYCDFVSNSARDDGGAMYGGNAYACTFTENEAAYENERDAVYEYYKGGAIYDGNAYNCTFIENFANDGGAMYDGIARNCIFKENKAQHNGGAVDDVDAYYCTFTENRAHNRNGGGMNNGNAYHCIFKKNSLGSFSGYGRALADSNAYNCTLKDHPGDSGAMVGGKAALCKFNGDPIDDVDIIHPAINVLNHSSTYKSGEKLKFDLIVDNMIFDGFNITIEISKEGQFHTTVYALTGEGWIVDLKPGEYTAFLKLTDFPKEKSSSVNINVKSTFTDLNTTINGNNNSTIYLSNNDYFKFDIDSDVELINGIIINRDLTIYGNGTTINGDAITRIFKVEDNVNVKFYNINFINGKAVDGGAIYGGNAYNCFFRENTAERDGGAIYGGNAVNCTFNFNAAERDGGAIYLGNATDCTFNINTAEKDGGAITQGNAYNSTFIQNHADNLGGAIHLGNAAGCTFTSNTAGTGGAISQGNVYNSTFILNRADNVGGAIYLGNATDCTFTNSTAETGGVMYGGNAKNCTFTENKAYAFGGAIYGGNVIDCTFAKNKADRGGAIYQGNANNCTFTKNTADKGGAICQGNANNCTFTKNTAEDDGGAIFGGGAINCTFIGNKADDHGGAIHHGDGKFTAVNCTFTGNSADGGGATFGVDVFNCIFTNNTSTYDGGAVYYGDAKNCTFTGNTAERDGGAIFKGDAINCTFIGNTAHHGGAMNCEDNNRNYTAEGCTFIGNSADGGGATYGVDVFNCIFTNNTSTCDGGAVYKRTAVNCTFTGNTAERDGGAIFKGDAINCTFIGNSVQHQGGAMYEGTACLCIFNEDSTKDTKIIHPIINVLNYASTYNSGEKLKFNLTANDMVFDGFKTSIAIYKNGSLVKTASGLSGEGWIVDLGPGEYTAVLSLTDYPDEKSSNATINVSKGNTIIDIGPINNAKVGQELTINYTTNSNGTVTIKVNGQKIKGSKFTPTKEGIYNLTVEVAENDYYIAASNKTAFTVEKTDAVVEISPITNVVVGQEVTINYTTNSNGTVTIKVDGQKISGNKFTPTKVGSYVVSVEVAENDYYAATSNETAFTVKTNAVVVISPIANVVVGQEVTINYTTNSNGTVTIKVNGQKINGTKFTPTKEGSYNVSVDVAENDYYTVASNETAFTVEKISAVVVISPITNVVVGQEVTINYTTNSNGTVTIKVNGQKISGTKFTPTKEGIYNVTVEVAENDYYAATSNETAFTVEKTSAVVVISPIANVVIGQEVTIKYNTNSNGTVTVKVNGQKIKGSKFTPTKEGIYNVTVEVAENDYYSEASNETAFTVEKTVAVVVLSPIANVVVGQEVTINYTTNSNGTVTIKVNGQKINSTKFTPTKDGIYNVTVEIAVNDYYTAASNKTAFTAEKTDAVVEISPIANVVVGQEVTINYTTNSNGTVTIKVNGQKISGSKFTPTKVGSYNVSVDVAENDYYIAASNETAFTVEKISAVVVISPIANVVVGQEVTINYTTNSNGTVTIKVDGQKISGNKFTPTKEGSYNVSVDVAVNDYYTEASNKTKFWVEKIDNYTADINIGEDSVTVILPEDINGKLTVKVGNEIFTVPVKNGVAVIPYDDLPAGENSITVTYRGDNKYAEKSFDFNVTVEPKVIITAKDLIKYYGSPERFIVSIKDSEGRPIAGQIVYITLNGKTYDRTTDNEGMASIGVNLNSGNYTAAVKVNETELTASITVLSTVNGTNIVKIFRNATQYYVTARDSNGNYLPENTEIDFNINGVFYKRKVTGDKGLAKLNINLIPNTYIITAYNTVTGERISNNITVLSRLTENKNITMYEKNGTKYTVRVLDETGKAVGAGENVTFNINGVLYTRTTDSNGYAALNINLMSGNYIITAMYGDSKVANNIKILPRLVASNLIKKYGTPDQFKAQLLDGKGNPVVGEKITFNINGIFYYRPTDADGFAKLNINLMPGKYVITSSYGSFVCGNTVTVNG